MSEIGEYTTKEITILVPMDLREANVYVTFKQGGKIVLEKNETEFSVLEDSLVIPLTQEDTSHFKKGPLSFQIKYVFPDGSSDISNELSTLIVEAYKKGVIEYVPR